MQEKAPQDNNNNTFSQKQNMSANEDEKTSLNSNKENSKNIENKSSKRSILASAVVTFVLYYLDIGFDIKNCLYYFSNDRKIAFIFLSFIILPMVVFLLLCLWYHIFKKKYMLTENKILNILGILFLFLFYHVGMLIVLILK